MALNDESLAIFKAIPTEWRAMLQTTCHKMADVFNLPSNAKITFQKHRQEEAESPVACRSALMALGQAAYSRLDEAALDSLVMEKMLPLVQKMAVALFIIQEEEQTSLWVARSLRIQEQMSIQSRVVAPSGGDLGGPPPAPPARVTGRGVLSAGAQLSLQQSMGSEGPREEGVGVGSLAGDVWW
ncbi:unnamed protein product [Lampetra fluviatilis]